MKQCATDGVTERLEFKTMRVFNRIQMISQFMCCVVLIIHDVSFGTFLRFLQFCGCCQRLSSTKVKKKIPINSRETRKKHEIDSNANLSMFSYAS